MEATPERAFKILDFYCKHGTRLRFGGRISGEEAASVAEVMGCKGQFNGSAVCGGVGCFSLGHRNSVSLW